MSWSSNREKSPGISDSVIGERIKNVNEVLLKLSKDEDLQDDLKLPEVLVALNHWTGKVRLPPEEAETLEENRRVVYVLQRLQMLQSVCRVSQISVPFDHFLKGRPCLSDEAIINTFGTQFKNGNRLTPATVPVDSALLKSLENEIKSKQAQSANSKEPPKVESKTEDSVDLLTQIKSILYKNSKKYFKLSLASVIALLAVIFFMVFVSK